MCYADRFILYAMEKGESLKHLITDSFMFVLFFPLFLQNVGFSINNYFLNFFYMTRNLHEYKWGICNSVIKMKCVFFLHWFREWILKLEQYLYISDFYFYLFLLLFIFYLFRQAAWHAFWDLSSSTRS